MFTVSPKRKFRLFGSYGVLYIPRGGDSGLSRIIENNEASYPGGIRRPVLMDRPNTRRSERDVGQADRLPGLGERDHQCFEVPAPSCQRVGLDWVNLNELAAPTVSRG